MTHARGDFAASMAHNLGQGMLSLLEDKEIEDIIVLSGGAVWIRKRGDLVKQNFQIPPNNAKQIINLIASHNHINIDKQPTFCVKFPYGGGGRFQAFCPPVSDNYEFTLRVYRVRRLPLSEYVKSGVMTKRQHEFMIQAIKDRKNILVAGGMGSGKTTFLNSCLDEIAKLKPVQRLIVIEDMREIDTVCECVTPLTESEFASQKDLLKQSLRASGDRYIFGELRDEAALHWLIALNTGQRGGLATIHADNAADALLSLQSRVMLGLAEGVAVPKLMMAKAINVIVYLERGVEGRRLREIFVNEGFDQQTGRIKLVEFKAA